MATVKKCYLLALPAELRNRIYDLAFTGVVVVIDILPRAAPGLLLACKQTHSEAHDACWRNSNFCTNHPAEIRLFHENLNTEKSKLISTFTFDNDYVAYPRQIHEQVVDAQTNLFWIIEKLRVQGITLSRDDAIPSTFRTAAGEVASSATPWKTSTHLYETNPHELAPEDEDRLKRYVPLQNRFFEHDHRNNYHCWHHAWMYNPGWTCDFPKKEVEANE